MNLLPTSRQWRYWSLPSKLTAIGTLIGILSLGIYGIEKTFQLRELFFKPKHCIKLAVFRGERHLGDNIYARIGGESLPVWDDPSRQKDDDLIFYDKKEKRFLASWGAPKYAQLLAKHYKSRFSEYNLEAYANIKAISSNCSIIKKYAGHYIQIDSDTCLVWCENEGNFYYRYAPFARIVSMNLYKELYSHYIDPFKIDIKSARIIISGLHGGKRQDQDENIELLINGTIQEVAFKSLEIRNKEVLSMEIPINELSIDPTRSISFGFVVLPFSEKYPLPPPKSDHPQIGPAHFRDVEVGDTILEIIYENK